MTSGSLTRRLTGTLPAFALLLPAAATAEPVRGADAPQGVVARHSELSHGASFRSSLASSPALFPIRQDALASYEVVVDEGSGHAAADVILERLGADGSTVLQTGTPVGTGPARRLRFTGSGGARQFIRVRSASCASCGPSDHFRIRAYETTGRISRFNNTGGQASVILLQNTTAAPVAGLIQFWRADGTLFTEHAFALDPRGVLKLDTFLIPLYQNQSGHLTVTHDGGYGGLVGKAALVEPATGFSFDVPLTYRLR